MSDAYNFAQEFYNDDEYPLGDPSMGDDEFWNDSWSKLTHGPDDLLSMPKPVMEKTVVHDHPYCVKQEKDKRSESFRDLLKPGHAKKSPSLYDKPSEILENMVLRALADLKDEEAVKQKRALPAHILNSELYKLLCKDDVPKAPGRGKYQEPFGHLAKTSFRQGVHEESVKPGYLLHSKSMKSTTVIRFPDSGEVIYSYPASKMPTQDVDQSSSPSATTGEQPEFADIPDKFWTVEQCQAYDQWWQNLPSCPFSK